MVPQEIQEQRGFRRTSTKMEIRKKKRAVAALPGMIGRGLRNEPVHCNPSILPSLQEKGNRIAVM
jgi:hypothetical protein